MLIRAATTDDSAAVDDVITAAFDEEGTKVAAVWRDVVGDGLDRASLVAVDGAALVGHVGLSHGWLDARRRLVDVLVLSPLSVSPDRQGSGIGTTLLAAALDEARSLGAPAVFLEGDPRYYGPRGFARASGHGFEAPTRRTPEPAFQVALLDAHEPWMTGRLIYRDVWWAHDCAGLRDPLLGELEQALGQRG
ncbi:GNAT family N-acetyltransferase [Nocardioides bizhenqiangii]|uniref:N-acetyltransferase n=1 Tax=Nocardioides bizhenqiangii TaxID=3095076 RepID=A0ABZ0ZPJ8_9ACTN|nr:MULTISPECIES: N-acetyltransferase [unclassified Nocardioides]MDZ5621469.1 N-acetyltransferase [Nocardioides sp. HM23]WQQ25694.1 N-acetyltransferase [Nocardioides sp. HM61]